LGKSSFQYTGGSDRYPGVTQKARQNMSIADDWFAKKSSAVSEACRAISLSTINPPPEGAKNLFI